MLLLQISFVPRILQHTGKIFSIDFSTCSPLQQNLMYKFELSISIAVIECPMKINEVFFGLNDIKSILIFG